MKCCGYLCNPNQVGLSRKSRESQPVGNDNGEKYSFSFLYCVSELCCACVCLLFLARRLLCVAFLIPVPNFPSTPSRCGSDVGAFNENHRTRSFSTEHPQLRCKTDKDSAIGLEHITCQSSIPTKRATLRYFCK